MAISISTPSIRALKRAINLKQRIEDLEQALFRLIGGPQASASGTSSRGGLSAAGRARIAAAQRARWAKVKLKSGRHKMSAAGRAKIAAAARRRWKVAKAAGKTRL